MPTERLSSLDASFLYLERPAMHMHVAGVSVFAPARTDRSRTRTSPRWRRRVCTSHRASGSGSSTCRVD